jgi:Kef-type K+ transport system membrane component KefB
MDLSLIATYWVAVAVITLVTVFLASWAECTPRRRQDLWVFDKPFVPEIGLSMAQLGEFSFIALKPAQDLGVIRATLFPIIGIAVALTTLSAPWSSTSEAAS